MTSPGADEDCLCGHCGGRLVSKGPGEGWQHIEVRGDAGRPAIVHVDPGHEGWWDMGHPTRTARPAAGRTEATA